MIIKNTITVSLFSDGVNGNDMNNENNDNTGENDE